jgi:asparagine synthetase B (glutamine-hydrolysing)
MGGLVGIVNLRGDPVEESLFKSFLHDHGYPGKRTVSEHASQDKSFRVALMTSDHLVPPLEAKSAETARLCTYFYGELFKDEKISDDFLEELAEGFELENGTLPARLNGSFLLLFYEANRGRMTLAGDRTASLPQYYTRLGDLLAFGFRLVPFLNLPGFRPVLSSEAVSNFLGCGFILENRTLMKDILRLGPGQILIANSGRISVRNYWRYSFSVKRREDPRNDLVQELGTLIQRAVERRLDGGNIGVPLSGGFDSRSILGCVKKIQPDRQVSTVTWGFEPNRPVSDAVIADAIARHLKTRHTFFSLKPAELPSHFRTFVKLDEGRTDGVGNYPQGLYIFDEIRSRLNVNILLRGDEVFGWKENVSTIPGLLHSLDIHELRRLPNNYTYLEKRKRRLLVDAGREQMRRILKQAPYDDLHDVKDYLYFNQRLPGYLQPLNQLKTHSLWIRNPYLDNEILDFIIHLPTSMRLGKNLFIAAVRQSFPELIHLPIAERHNLIDWNDMLHKDSALFKFVRGELLEDEDGFYEIVDQGRLEKFIDCAWNSYSTPTGGRFPPIGALPGKFTGVINRRLGYFRLDFSEELFRLLILRFFIREYLHGHCELG